MSNEMQHFEDFWPYYIREHAHPLNRRLHLIGTGIILLLLVNVIFSGNLARLILIPLVGYGFAWVGHFLIEKNKPATFKHPLWSLRGDFKMFFLAVTGKLQAEIDHINRSNH